MCSSMACSGHGYKILLGITARVTTKLFVVRMTRQRQKNRPVLRSGILAKWPIFACGIYDCVGFASLDRRNRAPQHVTPTARR